MIKLQRNELVAMAYFWMLRIASDEREWRRVDLVDAAREALIYMKRAGLMPGVGEIVNPLRREAGLPELAPRIILCSECIVPRKAPRNLVTLLDP